MTSPILNISEEILDEIFLRIALDSSAPVWRRVRSIMSCNRVCRRWRNTAVNYPKIWASIIDWDSNNASWTIELLNRSYPYPLDIGDRERIETLEKRQMHDKVMEALISHITRLRIFKLQNQVYWAKSIDSHFLLPSAPNLEALYLQPPLFHKIPLLRHNTLRLCSLELANVERSSQVLRLNIPTLLELKVRRGEISIDEWIELLSTGMPRLRWLALQDCIAHSGYTPMERNANYSSPVPYLEMIVLEGYYTQLYLEFLDALSPPSNCGIQFTCSPHEFDREDRDLLSAFLLKRLKSWPKDTPDRYLSVQYSPPDWPVNQVIRITNVRNEAIIASLAARDYSISQRHKLRTYDPDLLVEIGVRGSPLSDETSFLLTLLGHFKPTLTTTIEMSFSYKESIDAPLYHDLISVKLFAHLTSLKTLRLDGSSPYYFLSVLWQTVKDDNSGDLSFIMPQLQSIVLNVKYYKKAEEIQGVNDLWRLLKWRRQEPAVATIRRVVFEPTDFNRFLVESVIGDVCELEMKD